jgi:hypothetical protein
MYHTYVSCIMYCIMYQIQYMIHDTLPGLLLRLPRRGDRALKILSVGGHPAVSECYRRGFCNIHQNH